MSAVEREAAAAAERASSLIKVTATRAPLGLRIDHSGVVASVLASAESTTRAALRCGDELVGLNDTSFVDPGRGRLLADPCAIFELLSDYVAAAAFPLRITFRREAVPLCCAPRDSYARRTLVPSKRSRRSSAPARPTPPRKRRRIVGAAAKTPPPPGATAGPASAPVRAPPPASPPPIAGPTASSITGITGAGPQRIPEMFGCAAYVTNPGRDCVAALLSIYEARAPPGEEGKVLRKYAPARTAVTSGSRRAFLDACAPTLSRAELRAAYAATKRDYRGLLPLDKFLAASKFQCFLVDTDAARADYARLRSATVQGGDRPARAYDAAADRRTNVEALFGSDESSGSDDDAAAAPELEEPPVFSPAPPSPASPSPPSPLAASPSPPQLPPAPATPESVSLSDPADASPVWEPRDSSASTVSMIERGL